MKAVQGQAAGFADNADANQMYHLAERVAKLEGAVPHSATKADINKVMEEISKVRGEITAFKGEVKNNFTKVNARLERLEERLDRLEASFARLEKRVDKRFYQLIGFMSAGFLVLLAHVNPHVAEYVARMIDMILR